MILQIGSSRNEPSCHKNAHFENADFNYLANRTGETLFTKLQIISYIYVNNVWRRIETSVLAVRISSITHSD